MSSKLLFYYLGDDEAYFRALQGEFREHVVAEMEFIRISELSENKIQSLFLSVYEGKPNCVFIDFSTLTQDYLHLARLFSRTPMEHSPLLVGLVDYLSPPEVLKESIVTGISLNYIKSAETFDVVYAVTKMIAPKSIADHGFAVADLKERWDMSIMCKIGYVYEKGIHLETDFPVGKGEKVLLNHHWLQKRIVPSKKMFVKDVSQSNMFYQFKYNADLEFVFVDEFIPTDEMTADERKIRKAEREDSILHHKKMLKNWMEDNIGRSLEKRAKVLVVDREFNFFRDQPRTDKYPFTIRCIPFFTNIEQELDRLRPQVIAFNLEDGENVQNGMEALTKLVAALKKRSQNDQPFLTVFNTQYVSEELQFILGYPRALAYNLKLVPELVIKLSDLLQKKLTKEESNQKTDVPKKVFIKKNNLASIAEIELPVMISKLSETDMVIVSETQLPAGLNLHFTKPVEMFVYIQPAKATGKFFEYYGLIHCLGEVEKQDLRHFVNSIFFRDLDAQKSAEIEEFKRVHAKILEEREARRIAEAEAAAKKAAEDAAAKAEESTPVPVKNEEPQPG